MTPNATLTVSNVTTSGCSPRCPDCREMRAQVKVAHKPIPPAYLGPIPFATQFPKPREGESKWLTDHWPKKRKALRAEMLAEAVSLNMQIGDAIPVAVATPRHYRRSA